MIDEDRVKELLQRSGLHLNLSTEDFDKSFADIGIDSLDLFNFLAEVEISLGKSISDTDLEDSYTLNKLMKNLNR